MNNCNWLEKFRYEDGIACGDPLFEENYLKDNFKVVPIFGKGILVLHTKPDNEYWLDFAVLQWCCSNVNGTNNEYTLVFHGSGTLGELRECRHTWWGGDADGYVFYPDGRLISSAFLELSNYFDNMV